MTPRTTPANLPRELYHFLVLSPDELTLQRELQEAQRRWLDAETRAMDAEQRLMKWQQMHFDLQQKMFAQAAQQACDALAAPWVALAAEIRSKA